MGLFTLRKHKKRYRLKINLVFSFLDFQANDSRLWESVHAKETLNRNVKTKT